MSATHQEQSDAATPHSPAERDEIPLVRTTIHTLGHAAVQYGNEAARYLAGTQVPEYEWEGFDDSMAEAKHVTLKDQKHVADLATEEREVVVTGLRLAHAPLWLQSAMAAEKKVKPSFIRRTAKLTEKVAQRKSRKNATAYDLLTNLGDPSKVDPATALNVFQWHNSNQEALQDTYEREVIAPMRARFSERLGNAVKKAWAPPSAIDMERRRLIAETPVMIDDLSGKDPNFDNVMPKRSGSLAYTKIDEQTYGRQAIVLSRYEAMGELKDIEETFTHEMIHIITGDGQKDDGVSLNAGYGVGRLFASENGLAVMLNEATTEHLTQALLHGNIDISYSDRGSYHQSRNFLMELCNGGSKKLSPQLFTRLMLSHRADDTERSINDIQTALSESFGKDDVMAELESIAESIGGATEASIDLVRSQLRTNYGDIETSVTPVPVRTKISKLLDRRAARS